MGRRPDTWADTNWVTLFHVRVTRLDSSNHDDGHPPGEEPNSQGNMIRKKLKDDKIGLLRVNHQRIDTVPCIMVMQYVRTKHYLSELYILI